MQVSSDPQRSQRSPRPESQAELAPPVPQHSDVFQRQVGPVAHEAQRSNDSQVSSPHFSSSHCVVSGEGQSVPSQPRSMLPADTEPDWPPASNETSPSPTST